MTLCNAVDEGQLSRRHYHHDRQAGFFRFGPYPVNPALVERCLEFRSCKSEPQSEHTGLLFPVCKLRARIRRCVIDPPHDGEARGMHARRFQCEIVLLTRP